jgi:hypothetical protein
MIFTACSSNYDSDQMDYAPNPPPPGYVRPTFANIFVQTDQNHSIDAPCAMVLTSSGVGAIAAVAFPPAGVSAWIVYGLASAAGVGLGDSLRYCYNQYVATKTTFDVYTQCPVNHPTLQSTFDTYGEATAFVNLDFCKCSLACQMGFEDAPGVLSSSLFFQQDAKYYHDGQNHVNGPVQETPPPPDYNAIAQSMDLTYTGCNNIGVNFGTC